MDLLYLLQGGRGAGTSASHGLFEDEHNDHRAAKQEQQVDAQHGTRLLLYLIGLVDLNGCRRDLRPSAGG